MIAINYEELEKEMRSIKDAANEIGAGNPPAGYSELEGDVLKIADACYQGGMYAMEIAVMDWVHDRERSARRPPASVDAGTPRTDAEVFTAMWAVSWNRSEKGPVVGADFARTIERENAALTAQLSSLATELKEANADKAAIYDKYHAKDEALKMRYTENLALQAERDSLAVQLEESRATCAELVTDGNAITLAANLAKKSQECSSLAVQLEEAKKQVRVFAKVADNHKAAETALRSALAEKEKENERLRQ